jgi:Zn-dependent protease with chaperone function
MSNFFGSVYGAYMAQSFLHSIVAAALTTGAARVWRLDRPRTRQMLGALVVVLPAVSYPLYQLINPERDSLSFRMEALFDIQRWLNLRFFSRVRPGGFLLIAVFFLVCLVFIFQELVPVLRSTLAKHLPGERDAADDPRVALALKGLSTMGIPKIFFIEDEDYVLFSLTGKERAIYISTGLAGSLNTEELRAALAHEIAHINHSRSPVLAVLFLFRVLLFFNPVTLLGFRKIIHEEELACDEAACRATGGPGAMAGVLAKFYDSEFKASPAAGPRDFGRSLEEYSHRMLLEHRLERLRSNEGPCLPEKSKAVELCFTAAWILAINYFVV